MKVKCFLMDKCLKSDFTFQMASSLPSTTLRKKHGAQRSEFRHLPRLYDIDNPQSHLTWQRRYFIFSCARIDAHLIPVLFFAKILLNLQTVLKPDVCRNIILLKSAGRKT